MSVQTGALETALARLAGDNGDVVRIELGLLRSFRKYALSDAHCTDTIWHWLALAQHAGLPTRLLDWTYSPLVALHFVTARVEGFDQDGEVWCVDFPRVNKLLPRRLRQLLDAEQSEALTVDMLQGFDTLSAFDRLGRCPFVVFVEPPTVHPRLAAQHALFSLMPNATARLDGWLMQHTDVYRRVVIPAALKCEIRDKLDQANIHERVLHGGLDGQLSVDGASGARQAARLSVEYSLCQCGSVPENAGALCAFFVSRAGVKRWITATVASRPYRAAVEAASWTKAITGSLVLWLVQTHQ